jgi:hypothetical protein
LPFPSVIRLSGGGRDLVSRIARIADILLELLKEKGNALKLAHGKPISALDIKPRGI